jgi:hypothetical protein
MYVVGIMSGGIFLDPPFLANLGWIDQNMPNWLICQTGQTGWYIPLVGILSPSFGTLKSRGAHIVSPSKWQWFFGGLLLVWAKQGPILVKSKIIILMMPLMLVKPLELFSGSSIFPLTLGLSTYHIDCWFITPKPIYHRIIWLAQDWISSVYFTSLPLL